MLPVHGDQEISRIAAPYLTWSTILLCAVVLAWQSGLGQRAEWQATYSFGFIPGVLFSDFGRPPAISLLPSELTLVTYQFLHGGVGHLLSNMVVLFVFGGVIEDRLRHWKFGLLYLTSGVVAGLAHGLVFSEGTTALVGASGSIAGVMGAYLLLFPRAKITLLGPLFIPLRFRAWVFILFWFGTQVFMVQFGGASNVAWWAHIGGFLVGAVAGLIARQTPVQPDT